jgi:hypothetical protein
MIRVASTCFLHDCGSGVGANVKVAKNYPRTQVLVHTVAKYDWMGAGIGDCAR